MESENWRERVIIQEKDTAIRALLAVAIDDDDDTIVDAEEGELIDDVEQDAVESHACLTAGVASKRLADNK